jgi:uncharacterized protein with NAD-binding domain and iron-sulfur cluster
VVVVGAGLAGLTAGQALARAGYEVLVLERGGHLGGKLSSAVGYGDMPIEHGVHGWWRGYANSCRIAVVAATSSNGTAAGIAHPPRPSSP